MQHRFSFNDLHSLNGTKKLEQVEDPLQQLNTTRKLYYYYNIKKFAHWKQQLANVLFQIF